MIIIIDLKSYYLADTINYFYTGFQITFFLIKYKNLSASCFATDL